MPNQMHAQRRRPGPGKLDPGELDALDRRLLDTYQRGLPVVAEPYRALAVISR